MFCVAEKSNWQEWTRIVQAIQRMFGEWVLNAILFCPAPYGIALGRCNGWGQLILKNDINFY